MNIKPNMSGINVSMEDARRDSSMRADIRIIEMSDGYLKLQIDNPGKMAWLVTNGDGGFSVYVGVRREQIERRFRGSKQKVVCSLLDAITAGIKQYD